jgi:hypothetical protein
MDREPFQPGDRVKNRNNGIEGTVKSIRPQARRCVEWDNDRITIIHIGDLLELVD